MKRLDCITALTALMLLHAATDPATKAAEFQSRDFTSASGFQLKYRLLIPEKYEPSKSYPLVMFLHGGQQRRHTEWTAATRRGAMFCGHEARQRKQACFVFVPWASEDYNWGSVFEGGPSKPAFAAIEAIDSLEQQFNIDKRRQYITGLSGGGKGTWGVILSHPGRFAAAIPLCARHSTHPETADLRKYAQLVKDLPIWMWHGAKDPSNDPLNSRLMFQALQDVGAVVQYTEVPDALHNCWDTAYRSDKLHDWLFQQRLPDSIKTDSDSRIRRRDAVLAASPWTVEPRPTTGRRGQLRTPQAATDNSAEPQSDYPLSLPAGDWFEHGFTAEQRQALQSAFQRGIDSKAIPGGSLLLMHQGEAIFREGFGVADTATGRPFTVNAPCRIASLSKPHSATVLAILADRGKLTLDDPIDAYLPEFSGVTVRSGGPATRRPTVAECLSHTAGFPGNNEIKSGKFALSRDSTLAELVAQLATKPLARQPGTEFAYTELGYMTAGRIAEVVTGETFEQVMQELLLKPVGAPLTTFHPSAEMLGQMPTAYQRTEEGLQLREGRAMFQALDPGGSLTATLDGVGRVMLLHRNRGMVGGRRVISEQTLRQMYVRQPATKGTGYGLGFNTLRQRPDGTTSRVMHIGASGTLAVIDFEQDFILVILTQVGGQDTTWRRALLRLVDEMFESTSS